MPHTITVGTEPDGRPVALKSATDPASVDRIAGEAERLRLACHPGVIELIRVDEVAGVLATSWAPGGSLAAADVSLQRAAASLAAAATTMVELHERGLVHGRIELSHLLLGLAGETWLTGFAEPAGNPTPGDDTTALAAAVEAVLAVHRVGTGRRVPARPSVRSRDPLRARLGHRQPPVRGGGADRLAIDLRQIADRAAQPLSPLTDRELARLLREAVERGEATRRQGLMPARTTNLVRRGALVGAAGLVFAAVALVAWRRLGNDASSASGPVPATATTPSTTDTSAAVNTSSSPAEPIADDQALPAVEPAATTPDVTVIWATCRTDVTNPSPASTQTPDISAGAPDTLDTPGPTETADNRAPADPGGTVSADVDGDGCPEQIRLVNNTIETPNGSIEVLVEHGDVVRLGDWTCTGEVSVAVLRTSGAIALFDRWPTSATPAIAHEVAAIVGAVGLDAPLAAEPQCLSIVHLTDGSQRQIPMGTAR